MAVIGKAIVVAAIAAIGAEGQAGLQADNADRALAICEAHLSGRLDSPDSYRRISAVQEVGPATTVAAFDRAIGLVRPAADDPRAELWQLEHTLWARRRLALRTVTIRYTGDRAAERSGQCGFREVDGEMESDQRLQDRQDIARGMATLDAVRRERGGRTFAASPRFSCCL